MAYLNLTTNEQIRAILTISESNLPDEVLDNYGLEDELEERLEQRVPGWTLITAGRPMRLLRMVAKYFCAATVSTTAGVFVLKKETDGSNEGQRSDKEAFSELASKLMAKADWYQSELLNELQIEQPVSAPYTQFSRAIPDRDPITEARG